MSYLQDQILGLLATHPGGLHATEIAVALGVNEKTIQYSFRGLQRFKYLAFEDRGHKRYWRLLSGERRV